MDRIFAHPAAAARGGFVVAEVGRDSLGVKPLPTIAAQFPDNLPFANDVLVVKLIGFEIDGR